jgi:hypothetical protein
MNASNKKISRPIDQIAILAIGGGRVLSEKLLNM